MFDFFFARCYYLIMNVTSENPIKTLRLKNNVTQEELADAIGVCRTTIQAWETGKKQPRSKNLKKIKGYFSLSREEINLYFKEIEEDPENPALKECEKLSETPQIITTATQMEIAINEVSYIQEQDTRSFAMTEITPNCYSIQAIASPSSFLSRQQIVQIDQRERDYLARVFPNDLPSNALRKIIRKKILRTVLLSFFGSAIFLLLSNFFIWLYLNETTYYKDGYHYTLFRVTQMNLTGINILGLIFVCCVVCIASFIHFMLIKKKLNKGKDQ